MLRRRRRMPRQEAVGASPSGAPETLQPFTVVRNGYSMPDVAAFVGRISVDLSGMTPQDVRRAGFSIARRGYDKAEVIAYLNRVAGEIEEELAEARAVAMAERIAARAAPEPDRQPPEAPAPDVIWVSPDPPVVPAVSPTESPANTLSAAGEIADLLRATHDNAVRLRTQAEADVRHTVETTRAELLAEQQRQLRELSESREAAEHKTAQLIHNAELESLAIRQRGQQDAAAARAAAAAVLAQAKAEIEAVKALARHNLAAIDAAREDAIAQSREMLALGRGMLQTVIDLDTECDARLVHSRRVVAELMRTRAG